MKLFIGATLCGRSKTIIGKWQLIIKISSTLRGEDKGEGEVGKLKIENGSRWPDLITTLLIAGC